MKTRGGRSRGLQCSMGDTSREIGRGRGWRLPPLRRSGGGENRRGGRSQGLQCSMGDKSREIGRGRGWRLPPLRRSGSGENHRSGRSQGLQCSRVLEGSGGVRGRVHSTRPSEGAELPGRGPRKCTVMERRSAWKGPQHPSVGGG